MIVLPHRVLFRIRIGAICGNEMTNPAECSASPDPKARGKDQPQNSCKNSTVIKLTNSGNYQTQHTCQNWIAHYLAHLRRDFLYDMAAKFVLSCQTRCMSIGFMASWEESPWECRHRQSPQLLLRGSSAHHLSATAASAKLECLP